MSKLRSTLLRLTAFLALALGVGHSVHAATTIYGIRGTGGPAGTNDIIRLDPATGAVTLVYNNYPGGNAATIAQCPNGLIYYAINTACLSALRFQSANADGSAGNRWYGARSGCAENGVLARRRAVLHDRKRGD